METEGNLVEEVHIGASQIAAEVLPVLLSDPARVRGYACNGCQRFMLQVMDADGSGYVEYQGKVINAPYCNGEMLPMTLDQITALLKPPTIH